MLPDCRHFPKQQAARVYSWGRGTQPAAAEELARPTGALLLRRTDHDVRTRRPRGHQPRRAIARFGGQPGGLGRSERHVNHPAQVRVLHFPAGAVEACSCQHIKRPRLPRHGELSVLHFLEADLVALCPSHLLRQELTAPRHEWLQILVVAGNIEGSLRGLRGETDQFILSLPNLHPPAPRVIPQHSRAFAQFHRRRQNCARNLDLRGRNVSRSRYRGEDHHRKHCRQFHSRPSLRTRRINAERVATTISLRAFPARCRVTRAADAILSLPSLPPQLRFAWITAFTRKLLKLSRERNRAVGTWAT